MHPDDQWNPDCTHNYPDENTHSYIYAIEYASPNQHANLDTRCANPDKYVEAAQYANPDKYVAAYRDRYANDYTESNLTLGWLILNAE